MEQVKNEKERLSDEASEKLGVLMIDVFDILSHPYFDGRQLNELRQLLTDAAKDGLFCRLRGCPDLRT
jgi:hypothetical protein